MAPGRDEMTHGWPANRTQIRMRDERDRNKEEPLLMLQRLWPLNADNGTGAGELDIATGWVRGG